MGNYSTEGKSDWQQFLEFNLGVPVLTAMGFVDDGSVDPLTQMLQEKIFGTKKEQEPTSKVSADYSGVIILVVVLLVLGLGGYFLFKYSKKL